MTAKLIGYKVGVSKKSGKEYCAMHLQTEPSAYDLANGFVGTSKSEVIFTPTEQIHYLLPSDIGKIVELDYDRSYLVSVTVKKN